MWLHFLYGVYGYAYYELQDIVGVRIAEFLGNTDNANDIDCLASFVFRCRLEKIGDDKIQDIFPQGQAILYIVIGNTTTQWDNSMIATEICIYYLSL